MQEGGERGRDGAPGAEWGGGAWVHQLCLAFRHHNGEFCKTRTKVSESQGPGEGLSGLQGGHGAGFAPAPGEWVRLGLRDRCRGERVEFTLSFVS